ncbi:MAG: ABC transporter substrate-binding protein, partial [Alphaproteobacteria bacterium]
IAVDIRPLEWGALYGDVLRGNFELFSLAWVGISDPDLYFAWLHSSMRPPRGNNRGGYASPTVDRLTEDARRATDVATRTARYR